MSNTIARELALTIDALRTCKASRENAVTEETRAHWTTAIANHQARIAALMSGAPSGSGIDNGTRLDVDRSDAECLTFEVSFHHMTNGMYDGWTEHTIKARASLAFGLHLQISGKNRNEVKDHLLDVYHTWLSEESQS